MSSIRTWCRAACTAGLLFACVPASAQDAANGEVLFRTHCQRCHGFPPLGGPETAPYNPGMIRSAIEVRVSRMRFLSFLTDSQLADIATFIGRTLGIVPRPERDYTDMWFIEAESGWGVSLIQHGAPGNGVFGVLFIQDSSGRSLWLVMPGGGWIAPANYRGELFRASGPHAAQRHVPEAVVTRPVGTMEIAFSGADAATLAYTVDGVTVEKKITRQRF